ncbi:MAG: type II/IV secretion system protein [Sphingobium sp.]|nr:type II/IV secretion system protein [Sphingobium sp.]MBP6111551.1 type II/IV secretion system protein [Sphingobium sp.]MBP8670520.1 type II/IV secretion system protein [Sphingobium sp.]MBP9157283.1 type II/IV secretion system protein [Sphingobium sp.]
MALFKKETAPVSIRSTPAHSEDSALESLMIAERVLSEEALSRARLVRQESGERLEAVITRLGLASESALAQMFLRATSLERLSADGFPAAPIGGRPLSPDFLRDMRMIPIALDEQAVTIAQANPLDRFAGEAMRFVFGKPIRAVIALPSDIDAAIERLYGEATPAIDSDGSSIDEDDLERMKDLVSDAPVIRAVNRLIADAVDARASDIHIEPTDDRLSIRFRLDGVLQDRPALPPAMRAPLVSRIKVMAGLNIAERRLPQDGRLRLAVRGHEIDLRVATAPSIHGESVVLRVLDQSNLALDFGTLGFDPKLADDFRRALHRPHGIVLVSGPTGSGKTTTLYAALAELNESGRKLLTVEDPIEYRLPGVIQTQVNPGIGFSFSSALRSFLRQDPDVMMVGEIRDGETAQIAVQAALTGHVILSTLHTNTAVGAVGRLLDMGVEPFLLSSVLNGVLAQRLVRQLCVICKEPSAIDTEASADLTRQHGIHAPAQLYRGAGCDACSGSGYKGRVALHELLIVTDSIGRMILHRADGRDIIQEATQSGMRSLMTDGIAKAAAGHTSLAEVLRVANES